MDLTVLVPYKTGSRKDWLDEAVASIPAGVKYILLENDGELADALNQGCRAADTTYVLRLDADDILDPESVEMQVEACWDVDVAYPSLVHLTETGDVTGITTPGEFCGNRLHVWNYVPGSGIVLRRDTVLRVGGWREMRALEDWDLWMRIHRAGGRFKWVADAKYLYRAVHDSRNKLVMADAVEIKNEIVGDEPELLATFYSQETVATTYWRCLLPARVMPAQVRNHRPEVDIGPDGEILFPFHRGAAIWQFPGMEYERLAMASMQELGIPCLVECDDNYLVKAPRGRGWREKPPLRGSKTHWPSHEIHRKIVQWCDGLIVTTDHLANQYRKVTDAPIFVCPNQIDPDDWQNTPLPDWYDPDKTYVGVAGSASHMVDMPLVAQALEWAAAQKGVEVVLFGPILDHKLKGRLERAGGVRHVPWTTDVAVARAMQRILDIGLAPVRENPWSSCRSDLKALEYLMSGAVPVLSDTIPYRGWTDGEFCRKAKDPKGFLRAVQDLVYRREERNDLAVTGRAHVLTHRTTGRNAHLWREAVTSVKRRELIAA